MRVPGRVVRRGRSGSDVAGTVGAGERIAPLRTGALIATFRCAAPARCGAFADERRIVAGDEGGRACGRACSVSWSRRFAAGVREAGARAPARRDLHRVLIATFRCAAPARCGAFADERRGGGRRRRLGADTKRASASSGSAAPRLPQSWSSTDSAPRPHRQPHRRTPLRSARASRRVRRYAAHRRR